MGAGHVNIEVKGEFAFRCHRSIWQWKVLSEFILARLESMNVFNPISFRPVQAYEFLVERAKIPLTKIAREAEIINDGPLETEREQPESLIGLRQTVWRELPKPICAIRSYFRELEKLSILEHSFSDTYYVTNKDKSLSKLFARCRK